MSREFAVPPEAPAADSSATARRRAEPVERLQRELSVERDRSAELGREIDELRFQMDVLERSYSKQLQDARLLYESAESARSELGVRVAELDAAREDAIGLLTEAKEELDRLHRERDLLRRRLAASPEGAVDGAGVDGAAFDEATINTLMDDARWVRATADGTADGAQAETESEELLAPDAVLPTSDA